MLSPTKTVIAYVMIAAIITCLYQILAHAFAKDPTVLVRLCEAKEWIEIVGTGCFVYWLVRRNVMDRRKTTHVIAESEHQLRTLVNAVPHFMCLKDGDGRLFEANQMALEVLGATDGDFRGKRFEDISKLSREVLRDFEAKAREVWESGMAARFERQFPLSSGEARVFDVFKVPLFDLDGKRKALAVVAYDVTEMKQAEEALRERESRYRLISENSSDLIVIIDTQGIIRYASPSHETILGLSYQVFLNESAFQFVHVDDVDEVRRVFYKGIEARQPTTTEFRYQKAGNKWVYLEARGTPIINDSGQLEGVVVVARDITERKLADRKLRESEQQFKSLFEHNPEAVYSTNLQGEFQHINQAFQEILGYCRSEVIGKPAQFLVVPEDLQKAIRHFESAVNGDPQRYEVSGKHKDGHRVDLSVTHIPIIVDGDIVGIFGIAKDITEQKRSEEFLRRSDKLAVTGQLAAGVAHEIRNPLTTLKGFLQLLQMSTTPNQGYYDIMMSELNRIEFIIQEFLLLARPQEMHLQTVDPRRLAESVITLLSSEAVMRNVRIQPEFDDDVPAIACDENRIKQVFINVFKNAIEAMPNGGDIGVQVRRQDPDRVSITVTDHGCGIPEELISRLGDPFYTTKENGTGLGLMVSQRIVEAHHGSMYIHSQMGEGTRVEVSLPALPTPGFDAVPIEAGDPITHARVRPD